MLTPEEAKEQGYTSITLLVKGLSKTKLKGPQNRPGKAADEALKRAGLIKMDDGGWHPTELGTSLGLKECRIDRSGAKTYCLYPPKSSKIIESLLNNSAVTGEQFGGEPYPDMSTAIKELYDRFSDLLDIYKIIDKDVRLCSYLDINFAQNDGAQRNVDYENGLTQLAYLLRYMFAYGFEYFLLWRDLLGVMKPKDQISVISVGCGNGVDYWSLVKALRSCDSVNTCIKYAGLDVVDWRANSFRLRSEDKALYPDCESVEPGYPSYSGYYLGDAGSFLDKRAQEGGLDADVILFPKSVLELPKHEETWTRLKSALGKVKSKTFYLAFSRPQFSKVGDDSTSIFKHSTGEELRNRIEELLAVVSADGRYNADAVDKPSIYATAGKAEGLKVDGYQWCLHQEEELTEQIPFVGENDNNLGDELKKVHAKCSHWWKQDEDECRRACRPDANPPECLACDRRPAGLNSFKGGYVIYRCERTTA